MVSMFVLANARRSSFAVSIPLIGLLALLMLLSPARAAEDGWAVLRATGLVEYRARDAAPWRQASELKTLPLGSTVRTGPNGLAVLATGFDSIEVEASTIVELTDDGRHVVIDQPQGRAIYEVGKRSASRFKVRAPTMTVVVKGTGFAVDSTEGVESVSVFDGAVSVESARGDTADVSAGMSASTAGATGGISVGAAAASRGSFAGTSSSMAGRPASQASSAAPAAAATAGPAAASNSGVTGPAATSNDAAVGASSIARGGSSGSSWSSAGGGRGGGKGG